MTIDEYLQERAIPSQQLRLLLACPLSLTLLAPRHLVRLRVSTCQFVGLTACAYGPFRLQPYDTRVSL